MTIKSEEWKVNTMGRRYYTAESSHGSDIGV